MTKRPSLTEKLADMSAKGDVAKAAKRDVSMATKADLSKVTRFDGDESIPGAPEKDKPAPGKPLPKVTLYAHQDVLKSIRLLAVEDGVQAQEILRAAVRAYLAQRGHAFTDLATGERA